MPSVVSVDALTSTEREFVRGFSLGLNQTQAAQRAGCANPSSSARDMLTRPRVTAAIEEARADFRVAARVSREDVIEGMKEAIEMAKDMSDPQTMIVGWRELAKVCGFYEAPKQRIEVSVSGNVRLSELSSKTDAELLQIIEGTATRVDDE